MARTGNAVTHMPALCLSLFPGVGRTREREEKSDTQDFRPLGLLIAKFPNQDNFEIRDK